MGCPSLDFVIDIFDNLRIGARIGIKRETITDIFERDGAIIIFTDFGIWQYENFEWTYDRENNHGELRKHQEINFIKIHPKWEKTHES